MAHLVQLDHAAHRQLRVHRGRAEAAAAHMNMAPVVLSEFLKLVVQYPIAFTKDRETGRFACVALFGLHDRENLFVEDGQWHGIYVPLQVARQPFFLGQASDQPGDERYLLCVDTEHPSLGAADGERIFADDGSETACLAAAKQDLAELLNGEEPTRRFIEHLASLKLLMPMHLEITFENAATTEVQGLYTIDEKRLEQLNTEELAGLHAAGHLGLIYTMLASLGHIYGLIDRRNRRDALAT